MRLLHQPPPEPVRLADGTLLVVVPEPKASAIAIAASVRVGLQEERTRIGLTALVARMLGADSLGRTTELLRQDVDAFGALGTEYDGNSLTAWTVCAPRESALAESAQTLLLNVLAQPRFTDTSLEAARAEQTRARTLAGDGPIAELVQALRARAFGTETSLLGEERTLRTATTATVQAFYRRYFCPDRTVVVVAGKTDFEAAKRHVEINLSAGDWGRNGVGPRESLTAPDPIPTGLRDRILPNRMAANLFGIGYLAPGLSEAGMQRDWLTLQVLNAVLGGGKFCRLFRLRDERSLAYEVRTLLLPSREATLWVGYLMGVAPTTEVKAAVLDELNALGSGARPVAPTELDRARGFLRTQHDVQRQLVLQRTRATAWSTAVGLGPEVETEFEKRLAAVTVADVNRLAKRVFATNPAIVRTA